MKTYADEITITPEVIVDSKVQYLIRIDGEHVAFIGTEKDAKNVVDSIASAEQKRLEGEWVKVFREDKDDGKTSIISIQKLGRWFNGSIEQLSIIDCVPVGRAVIVKNKGDEEDEVDLGVPIPEVLRRLAKLKESMLLKGSLGNDSESSAEDSESSEEDTDELSISYTDSDSV